MRQSRRGDAGVTLIEVLVSLAIFAVIGLAGLTVLDTVARTGERTDGRLDRLSRIDHAFLIIRRDLAQMTGLDARLDNDVLTFRRLHSSGSIRVTYRIDDGVLLREVRTGAPEPVVQHVLPGIATGRWRVLGTASQWTETWPPEGAPPPRARAAELTLEVMRDTSAVPQPVTRLFVLPAGQAR